MTKIEAKDLAQKFCFLLPNAYKVNDSMFDLLIFKFLAQDRSFSFAGYKNCLMVFAAVKKICVT